MSHEKNKIILHKDKNKTIDMLTALFIKAFNNKYHYEYVKTSSSTRKVVAKGLLVVAASVLLFYFVCGLNLPGILKGILPISIIMSALFSLRYLACDHLEDRTNEYLKLGSPYYGALNFNRLYTHGKKSINWTDKHLMSVWISYAGLDGNYKAYNQLLDILHTKRTEAYEEYHDRLQEVINYSASDIYC